MGLSTSRDISPPPRSAVFGSEPEGPPESQRCPVLALLRCLEDSQEAISLAPPVCVPTPGERESRTACCCPAEPATGQNPCLPIPQSYPRGLRGRRARRPHRLHPVISNVHGIVPDLPQAFCDLRREGVVHQEFHGTVIGNSRSRTASAA
jgi:hypothetical protein